MYAKYTIMFAGVRPHIMLRVSQEDLNGALSPYIPMCVMWCIDDITAHMGVLYECIGDHYGAYVGLEEQLPTPRYCTDPGRIRRRQHPHKARIYGPERCVGGLPRCMTKY